MVVVSTTGDTMKHLINMIALTALLAGCTDTQTTSGTSYLARYHDTPVATGEKGKKSIDQRVREAAAVEPVLQFPARIGLARVEDGCLTSIPVQEGEAWRKLRGKLGTGFGEFVPVSPLVAGMVAGDTCGLRGDTDHVINTIRLGAARQHLDAVLIYEVYSKETTSGNLLKVADLSLIGGYLLPSESHDVQGYANGLLIDVVQGYPYGTLQSTVEKDSRVSSSWGWGSDGDDARDFADRVKARAAAELSEDAYAMFVKLKEGLAGKKP